VARFTQRDWLGIKKWAEAYILLLVFAARRLHFFVGTCMRTRHASKRTTTNLIDEEKQIMTAGSKMFWAMLWVIGLPLPLLVILWMLFGSR
jgi:hypothetical protein